jgi:hypothetical protein
MSFQDDFWKRKIEKSMDHIQVPESIFTFAKELPYKMEEQSKQKTPRKSKWKKWLAIAAASITIGISAGAYLSPTFAAYIKSFFVRPDLDEGLQIAAKEGFSETTEASVTDNGITLKVKEVMADTNRLILTYSLEKENGEFIDPTILFESQEWGPGGAMYFVKDLNAFYITDKDGDIVSTSTNYRTKKGRFVTQYIDRVFPHYPYADLMFELNHSASDSKQLFANISINKIGSTEGKWNLRIPVNIEKSIKATKTLPINKEYVTSEGLAITLKNVVYSPTLTSLNFETRWTEKGKQLMEGHPEYFIQGIGYSYPAYHGFHYDIVDNNGKVIATTLPKDQNDTSKRVILSESNELADSIEWRYSFTPFPKLEKLTLVFKGVERTEYPKKSITFDPTQLKDRPITLKYKGNSFIIQNFKLKTNKNGEKVGILEIEERVPLMAGQFEISDAQGNAFPIDDVNSRISWLSYDEKTMTYRVKEELEIKGIETMPTQLTLTLKTAMVFYKDGNWKVPIPSPSEK